MDNSRWGYSSPEHITVSLANCSVISFIHAFFRSLYLLFFCYSVISSIPSVFPSFFLSFFSFFPSFLPNPSGRNIYGLVKATAKGELTNISGGRTLSEKGPKFASLQADLRGLGWANSNHLHAAHQPSDSGPSENNVPSLISESN